MPYTGDHVIYEKIHEINVLFKNDIQSEWKILIKILQCDGYLQIKLRNVNEYSFNYTTDIDCICFERLKQEQSLDIDYQEFKTQLVELLQQTVLKTMMVRIEADEKYCKIIFYEKSKIKSLIFLTVDLILTNQHDIINEMTASILELKESKQNLTTQISNFQRLLNDKEIILNQVKTTNKMLEKQFLKDLQNVENSVNCQIKYFENYILEKLRLLSLKLTNLMQQVSTIKIENQLKCESSARLVQTMQNMRLESEKDGNTIEELKFEIDSLTKLKNKAERSLYDLKLEVARKETEVEDLQRHVTELKKDMQEASIVIAQKTKTHNELAKDLVQANQMLVNFNNHYDTVAKEAENLREELRQRDQIISEQKSTINSIFEEFEKYKRDFDIKEFNTLRNDLFAARKRIEELEKENRETAKLNGVLTNKLSSGEPFNNGNIQWTLKK